MTPENETAYGCLAAFGLLMLAVAALFITGTLSLGWERTASPIREETRRLTQEQSQTYRDGMAIDLDNLCREYGAASGVAKAALADTIRFRRSRFNGELPPHVQRCLEEIR